MAFLSGLLMTKGRRQKAMRNKVENPAGFDREFKKRLFRPARRSVKMGENMGRRFCGIGLFLLLCLLFLGMEICRAGSLSDDSVLLGDTVWKINHYSVCIPDLDRDYSFLILNDLHLITESDEIREDQKEEVRERRDSMFIDADGNRSADLWGELVAELDSFKADGIIIAGDLLDFYSESNMEFIRSGLDKLETPYLYLRADHDTGRWRVDADRKSVTAAEKALCSNLPVLSMEFPGFIIAGINNSTSQITEKGLRQAEKIWETGKPLILFTHVPFQPEEDRRLTEEARRNWDGRALLWGEDCYYHPAEYTAAFMEMLFAEESPVRAVFAGHLHFPCDIMLNDRIEEHVLDANFKGNISVLTVSADQVR